MKSKMDEESVILFHTGVLISTVCARGRTVNFKLRMAGMKTKKPEGKKTYIVSVATSLSISTTMKQNQPMKNTASSFCN